MPVPTPDSPSDEGEATNEGSTAYTNHNADNDALLRWIQAGTPGVPVAIAPRQARSASNSAHCACCQHVGNRTATADGDNCCDDLLSYTRHWRGLGG